MSDTNNCGQNHGACQFPYSDDNQYCCRCHYQMGAEFWFLPVDRCLFELKPMEKE